jgi:hypothetical protein
VAQVGPGGIGQIAQPVGQIGGGGAGGQIAQPVGQL